MNANIAAEIIDKKTRLVMPVHIYGLPTDMNPIIEKTHETSTFVLEDAAEALGVTYNSKQCGSIGNAGVFSFYANKIVTGGEGGVVVSDDPDVIAKVRDSRLLGVVGDSEKRNSRQRSWDFDVEAQGWRYHMSDLFAAIAKTQLEKIEKLAGKRIKLFAEYNKLLQNEQQIELFDWDISDGMVPHIFVIRIPVMTSRHTLRQNLLKDGIPTGIHYKPNHLLSFFQSNSSSQLTNTELLYPEILTLPLHPRLKNSDLLKIVTKLRLHLDSAFE
jgi:dTDP-4-amino-4,6-dideoxygalactose transaminase